MAFNYVSFEPTISSLPCGFFSLKIFILLFSSIVSKMQFHHSYYNPVSSFVWFQYFSDIYLLISAVFLNDIKSDASGFSFVFAVQHLISAVNATKDFLLYIWYIP